MTERRTIDEVLLDLQMRMARVEAHLNLADPEEEQTPPVIPPPPVRMAGPPPLPVRVAQVQMEQVVPVVPEYEAPVAAGPVEQTELEQTIGLKWAGWVGAVVVVIGAGLGIKYAYDQRWFEILPPAGRLALMSLGGFALLAAGEMVYRRIHRVAAACLFGAGVATLFLVSYAGHGYYRLYEPETAYALMALTTAVGAAVAIRGNLLSIAVLTQLGGNLAPMLLQTDRPLLGGFLAYLLALQVVALALAWWGGLGRWWALRHLSLVTTALWVLAILVGRQPPDTELLLTFSLLYAAAYQLELILSALHADRDSQAPAAAPLALSMSASSPTALLVSFSFAVTALLTTALLFILRDIPDAAQGAWVLALAFITVGLGILLPRGRTEAHPLYPLAFGFRAQAAALVVVAVPVALSGVWVMLGWAALSLAFATVGTLLHLRISRWTAVMVWRLALLYLGWWTVGPITRAVGPAPLEAVGAHAVWLHLLGQDVRAYTILAWFLAAVGHAVAWLIHQEGLRPAQEQNRKFQRLAWVTNALAGFALVTASIAGLPPAGATFAILVYAWLLLGADLLNPRLGLVLQSAAVVALLTIKWVAVDTLAERLAPGWSPLARRPLFNAVMFTGVLVSATMAVLYWLRRDVLWHALTRLGGGPRAGASPAAPALALAALLMTLLTVGLTFEIDRVIESAGPAAAGAWPLWQLKHMAWTVLWTLCLGGFIALARRLEPDDLLRPVWVHAADVLLVLVATKFLLIDTLGYRVFEGPTLVAPLANVQVLTAVVVVGGMALLGYLTTRPPLNRQWTGPADTVDARHRRGLAALAGFLAVLVVLWGGTLEIDRAFEQLAATGTGVFANPARAKQLAFSIFWSVFAVAAIVAGFGLRTAGLRYFGLALFAFTLGKVVLFDMGDVQTGYRVLSFLGLGLLLLGTSVLYGKLSPVLLRPKGEQRGLVHP